MREDGKKRVVMREGRAACKPNRIRNLFGFQIPKMNTVGKETAVNSISNWPFGRLSGSRVACQWAQMMPLHLGL